MSAPRKRGRPPKARKAATAYDQDEDDDADDLIIANKDINRMAIDVLTALESSRDGLTPAGEQEKAVGGVGGGENTWFWRTFFQFRLPPYLQRVGQEGEQRATV